MDHRKHTGATGESLAIEHLKEIGYEIIATNWKCKSGEIDIVALQEQTLIFIEVRTRIKKNKNSYGTPQESVNSIKQRKVRDTAKVYIHQHNNYNHRLRFDVIAIYLHADGTLIELIHIDNAF